MRRFLCSLVLLIAILPPATASAAGLPSTWEKGYTLSSWWHDAIASSGAAAELDGIKATGANSVALMTTWYQASSTATVIAPSATKSPSDAALSIANQRAKARGLKTMLRPMVADAGAGTFRGTWAPSSPAAWFDSYRAMIYHFADFAQAQGIDTLEIGSELTSLTAPAYDAQWRTLIAGVRSRFSGRILYSAAWDGFAHVTFFDALDAIGIDAYFPLSLGATPSEDMIMAAWQQHTDWYGTVHRYVDEIAAVQARFGKPVIFTELGYASAANNLKAPWMFGTTYDAAAQQRALTAAFKVFLDKPWFGGVYVWEWQADPASKGLQAGGPSDLGHTPQNKPARDTLKEWFTAVPSTEAGTPTAPPSNAAPTVRLTAPTAGSTFTKQLGISATASDDRAVTRVDFKVDGALVKTLTVAPYSFSWRVPKKLAYGTHTVTATAYDAAGLSTSDTVSVTRRR